MSKALTFSHRFQLRQSHATLLRAEHIRLWSAINHSTNWIPSSVTRLWALKYIRRDFWLVMFGHLTPLLSTRGGAVRRSRLEAIPAIRRRSRIPPVNQAESAADVELHVSVHGTWKEAQDSIQYGVQWMEIMEAGSMYSGSTA